MSKVQMVRALVNQRLTATAEEIFGLFERTIAEYEEELCRSNEKNERQQKLLDAVLKPEVRLHRADIQQLLVVKEEVLPEQQEWSPSLDQEDPPEPPHIKEEQEELWTSQEGEQLQGLEEADITKFLFTPVHVKSEDDEEKPQSSQLHQRQTEQMETGADGEDCGGPEPARNSHPDLHLQPETEDSEDWSKDIREPPSDSKYLNNNEVSKSGVRCNTNENPLSCSLCGKAFKGKGTLKRHMVAVHTEEKRFSCSLCEKSFKWKREIKVHMAVHTGDRPFQCSVCEKAFIQKRHLTQHMTVHTEYKRFCCRVCVQRFTWPFQLTRHKRVCPQSSQLHQTEQNREAEPGASSSTEQMERTVEDQNQPETQVQISK